MRTTVVSYEIRRAKIFFNECTVNVYCTCILQFINWSTNYISYMRTNEKKIEYFSERKKI